MLFYLSFAGEEGWRGACFIEGDDLVAAVRNAHAHGCNPGGEVLAFAHKGDAPEIPESWRRCLLSKDDLRRMAEELGWGEEGDLVRVDSRGNPT